MTKSDWRSMSAMLALCLLFASLLLIVEVRRNQQTQWWEVECDGIHVQYQSPWPMQAEEVCSALTSVQE